MDKNIELLNATPHSITLIVGEDKVVIPKSGLMIRVESGTEVVGSLSVEGHEIEIRTRTFGAVTVTNEGGDVVEFPEEREGRYIIVSRIAAEAMPQRDDIVLVDGTLRNAEGQIIGCTAFARL